MTVYTALYRYDGWFDFIGTFSSEQKAQDAIDSYCKTGNASDQVTKSRMYYCSIWTAEVDHSEY